MPELKNRRPKKHEILESGDVGELGYASWESKSEIPDKHCNYCPTPHLQRKPQLPGQHICNEHCFERSHQSTPCKSTSRAMRCPRARGSVSRTFSRSPTSSDRLATTKRSSA